MNTFGNALSYLYGVVDEFKKIKVPEKKEIKAMSIGVLVVIMVLGLFFFLVDLASLFLINNIILGS